MKIKLISDVHFEFQEDERLFVKKADADVLVIAGDLAVGYLPVWGALKRFADIYKEVVYVPGNHEYYRQDMDEFDDYIRRFSYGTNIHFMNPGTVKIGDVTFIGAALWTNFRDDFMAKSAARDMISDFRQIPKFSIHKAAELFADHYDYIKLQYEAVEGKKVIVTHFLPAIECISPQFRGEGLINYYFANDLGGWIDNMKDTTWLFGHTHDYIDVTLGDTKVLASPYGYQRRENYQPHFMEI
jgi:Icc-related predicted phosphoesterase